MDSNNSNNIEFKHFRSKEKRSDGRKKQQMKRGIWTHNRLLALLVAYREHRPYGVDHGERTEKWNQVTADVNKKDEGETFLRKQAVINKLNDLVNQYKPTFTKLEPNKASGSNRFSTDIEREAYYTWQAIEEDKKNSSEEKKKKEDELIKAMLRMAVYGDERAKKRKLDSKDNKVDLPVKKGKKESGNKAKPIEIDEDRKLVQYTIKRSDKQHKEILEALQANTDAIKALHEEVKAIRQVFENKK